MIKELRYRSFFNTFFQLIKIIQKLMEENTIVEKTTKFRVVVH